MAVRMGISFSLTPGQTFWGGILLVIGFLTYKYVLLPIANEGQPIDPPETQDWY